LANQVKKIIRDDNGYLTIARRKKIIDEQGNVLWTVTAIANDIEANRDVVANENLQKLERRKSTTLIKGDQRYEPQ
jgi:hypothetical protein